MRARVNSLRAQIESSTAEKLQRETENTTIADQLVETHAERNAGEARDGLLRVESEQMRARLGEIEESLRQVRLLVDQARDRRGEVSAAAAELQSDAQYMGETCLNELGVQRQELMSDSTIPVVLGEQLANEDHTYREMRARLDAMGPVNMMALEEYKEISERHTFLETQRKDLLDSIENTQATIKEVDVFSRQKFEEAFKRSIGISRPTSAKSSVEALGLSGLLTKETGPKEVV